MQFVGISLRWWWWWWLLFQLFPLSHFHLFYGFNNHKYPMIFHHSLTRSLTRVARDIVTVLHTVIMCERKHKYIYPMLSIFSHHRSTNKPWPWEWKQTMSKAFILYLPLWCYLCAIYSIKCHIWIKWTQTIQWQIPSMYVCT